MSEEKNKVITVDYNLDKDTAEGEMIESTEGKEPLMFLTGLGQMIPDFENEVKDLNVGDTYIEQGATATDDIDGNISSNIVTGGDVVNTSASGTYFVTYDVSDAAGNPATQVVRTVNVIPDTTAPIITLIGSSPIDLNVGEVYTEEGATAFDDLDGDMGESVDIGGRGDTKKGGT